MLLFRLSFVITAIIALISIFSTDSAAQNVEPNMFYPVSLPSQGQQNGWVLAGGSSIKLLTQTQNGTLFAHVASGASTYTLFKSTNDGDTWSYTGQVKNNIVALAPAPDNPSVIFYATENLVFKSSDGGNTFIQLTPPPGGAGSANIRITSIAVLPQNGSYLIAAATRDSDPGQFGGVYLFDENSPGFGWEDTGLTGSDVFKVIGWLPASGLPDLIAVTNDETRTIITCLTGDIGWGAAWSDAVIPVTNIISADLVAPDDFALSPGFANLFLGLNSGTGNGDAYIIYGRIGPAAPVITDLNVGLKYGLANVDICSLAISGNTAGARLLAGTAGVAQVFVSTDGGVSWIRSQKPPTGSSQTIVLISNNGIDGGAMFAGTSGVDSAFSFSKDGGLNWSQASLIDTSITNLIDFAPSPQYDTDQTLFLLTFTSSASLWKSEDGGQRWQRIFSDSAGATLKKLVISPAYGTESKTLYLYGTFNARPCIWKSSDGGESFTEPRFTFDPQTGAAFLVDCWAIAGDSDLFLGAYDGSNGLIFHTTDGALTFLPKALAGTAILNSIAVSPAFERDNTIISGNTTGWAFGSTDAGITFTPVPVAIAAAPLSGRVALAFDPDFARNNLIYAASDTAGKGIYKIRFNLNVPWEAIDSNMPPASIFKNLVFAANTLYVPNAKGGTGLERCLSPSSGAGFETVSGGLETNTALSKIWSSGDQLWVFDTVNNRLSTYLDRLNTPPILITPTDKTGSIPVRDLTIDWQTAEGATSYKWQVSRNPDFTALPSGFEGTTQGSRANLPLLDNGSTYYWRVRATGPVTGPWSPTYSFTTLLAGEISAPRLLSPDAGAIQVQLQPVFQWTAIAGSESYELIIADNIGFTGPLISFEGANALPGTAWYCNLLLESGTTYYWKVRGSGSGSTSEWSPLGAFSTMENTPAPTSSPAVTATTTILPGAANPSVNVYMPTQATVTVTVPNNANVPGWLEWGFYLILAIVVLLLVVMVFVVIKISRR